MEVNGLDELIPTENAGLSRYGPTPIAVTAIAAMDTLLLMGLEKEYQEAYDSVVKKLDFDKVQLINRIG